MRGANKLEAHKVFLIYAYFNAMFGLVCALVCVSMCVLVCVFSSAGKHFAAFNLAADYDTTQGAAQLQLLLLHCLCCHLCYCPAPLLHLFQPIPLHNNEHSRLLSLNRSRSIASLSPTTRLEVASRVWANGPRHRKLCIFFRVRHPLSAKGPLPLPPQVRIDFSALATTHKARSSFVNMKFDKWAAAGRGSKRGMGLGRV